MKFFLVVQIPGPMKGQKIPLTVPIFTIGRDASCELQAGDPAIAELHCALETFEDKLVVHDLASPGGTFVNDARIAAETQLKDGDQLKVGPLLFRVSIEADKKPAPAAKPKAVAKKPERVDDQSASSAASKLLDKYLRKRI